MIATHETIRRVVWKHEMNGGRAGFGYRKDWIDKSPAGSKHYVECVDLSKDGHRYFPDRYYFTTEYAETRPIKNQKGVELYMIPFSECEVVTAKEMRARELGIPYKRPDEPVEVTEPVVVAPVEPKEEQLQMFDIKPVRKLSDKERAMGL